VIVRFVDIGEIVDHHCLSFLFITMQSVPITDINGSSYTTLLNSVYRLYLPGIYIPRIEGLDPINWFNPATFLCLSKISPSVGLVPVFGF